MPFTVEAIQVVLMFIVPGFIADQVVRLKNLRTQRDNSDTILVYLALSGLNAVLVSPFLVFQDTPHNWVWSAGRLGVTLFIMPVIIGLILRTDLVSKMINWFGRSLHPHPKAWDHVFSHGRGFWVRVTLADGKKIAGRYGENSFASSFPHAEDIYIEAVYSLDEDNWFASPVAGNLGVLIRGDKIASIEFFEGRDENVERTCETDAPENDDCATRRKEGISTESESEAPAPQKGMIR